MLPQFRDHLRYDILGEHGRGGLGRVSRAHDRELGRDIAIKELISRGHLSEVRFLREALITARLEHPGIVPVYEAGRWPDGTPFYAMKLVAGRPLRDLLAERTSFDDRLGLLHHVIAVADAIAYAHGRNIIHRDLKPANVIVGDFGETVVIDWGLAKDLTSTEESALPSGPFRATPDDGLTSAGSVLGTPAYMAPEQARGEPVDQRADVFAIGAMLWELCTRQKLPPNFAGERRRILRRAGIDQDLITIIDKAVDADPSRRYPDAGALAADLKAFKVGARIAARRYSLFALLSHWTRRHRAIAFVSITAVTLAVAATAAYLRNIGTERDRTDRALAHAETARNDLVLEHSALLLHSDPTTALATLAEYRGNDSARRDELLAEARGRGTARHTLHPHNDTVWCLAGQPDGSFISVAEDHRVRRTHGGVSTTLASNVSYTVRCAYSTTHHLLAYSRAPRGVGLLDLTTSKMISVDTIAPVAMAFSPDASQLAVLDKHGDVIVLSTGATPAAIYRGSFPNAKSVLLPQVSRLVAFGTFGVSDVDLRTSRSSSYTGSTEAAAVGNDYLVLGLVTGSLAVISPRLTLLATTTVCKQRVQAIALLPRRKLIGFGCEEGGGGIARYSLTAHTLNIVDTFTTDGSVWLVHVDEAEDYVWAIGDQVATAFGLDSKLTRRLEGQPAILSAIATPTRGFHQILTGDVNGVVRVWDPLITNARAIASVPGLPLSSRYSPDGTILAVFGTDPRITLVRPADESTTLLQGHTGMVGNLRFSDDGKLAITASWDGSARTWRVSDGALLRTFEDHHAIVQDSAFMRNSARSVSIGDDGRLFAWDSSGTLSTVYLATDAPLVFLQILSNTGDIITNDAFGALWSVSERGLARQIRERDGIQITAMRATTDGRFLAIGQENGIVSIYRTDSWRIAKTIQAETTIARIEMDPKDRDAIAISEDSVVHLIPLEDERATLWREFRVRAHDLGYSSDGNILSISALDGGSWFYSMTEMTWRYRRDHLTEVWSGRFSPDGAQFVSIDRTGLVVKRDTATIFDH